MSDLYQELGVPREADAATIKQAYRRLAQEHHPDKGGNVERFQAIKRAYEVLSDPELRDVYNRTGQVRSAQDRAQAVASEIQKMLLQAIEMYGEGEDLLKILQDSVQKVKRQMEDQASALERSAERYEAIAKRFKLKKPGVSPDPIGVALNGSANTARMNAAIARDNVGIGDEMIAVLKNYKYEFDGSSRFPHEDLNSFFRQR